jgi:hypothetical protein
MTLPIVYEYKLTTDDYRKMSFSSTFSHRRSQNIILFLVWGVSFTALMLELAKVIKMSQPVHICSLMVTVTVPMLLFSVLNNVHKFKVSGRDYRKKTHTVLMDAEKVTYSESDSADSGTDRWDDFEYAFETKDLFLLYRTTNNAVIIPKREVSEQQVTQTRELMQDKLGKRFKVRCRVKK